MSRAPHLVYEGEHLRALAMPLGGIGCGQVAICGDGGLPLSQHTITEAVNGSPSGTTRMPQNGLMSGWRAGASAWQ